MSADLSAHVMPRWWGECRYGMFVHANIATVPAFSPVHEYADWYWSHLETRDDVALHPTSPLPEVMAWHAEHWPGYRFDDFIPLLSYDRFDAGDYAALAVDAGMKYVVHVTKHHDGFCWWDTAQTDRNSVKQGPGIDVVAALAEATRARGLVFGTYYSLLDWGHPDYPDQARYVDSFMRPQLRELTERFQPAVLWGDGHWGHSARHWRSDALVEEYYAACERLGFEGCVNDRLFASHADFVTYEYDVPENPPDGPWEVCRGLAYSFCFNRAERDRDHLTPAQIVALLAETVAKGGNLLLNIGPLADGTVPEIQQRILREAGAWVNRHADAVHGSERFAGGPGRGTTWYTVTPDAAPGGRQRVNAIDLAGATRLVCEGLGPAAGRVVAVDGPGAEVRWSQTDTTLVIEADSAPADPLGAVYRVDLELAAARPVELRTGPGPGTVERDGTVHPTITAALDGAPPGSRVEVGAGRYTTPAETFPLRVPAGVTLAAAPGVVATDAVVDGGGHEVVHLAGDGAALEGVTVTGGAPGYFLIPATCVTSGGASDLRVRNCVVEAVRIAGGGGHQIAGSVIAGGNIWLMGADRSRVYANYQHGLRWGVGIDVAGGDGHVVEDNECRDDLCAVRVVAATGARVSGNRIESRWWGVHLKDAVDVVVSHNRVAHTMRAVGVEGGRDCRVEHLLAEGCDSGVVVERDATDTVISDSWFHDCRVGLLTWDDRGTSAERCAVTEARDHAVVTNSDVALDGVDLGGGSVYRVRADAGAGGGDGGAP